MGQVLVRNVDDAILERHRHRARERGVSLEQHLREVLAQTAPPDPAALRAELARCRSLTPAGHRTTAEEAVREVRNAECPSSWTRARRPARDGGRSLDRGREARSPLRLRETGKG